MAVYSITHHQRLDDYAVVQTLTPNDLQPGDTITVAGLGHGLNGTHTVYAIPQYLFIGVSEEGDILLDPMFPIANQVLFYDDDADLERSAAIPPGTLAHTPTCTWITATDIEDWLGIGTATTLDQTFLTICAASANEFCYRRRQEAGYVDSLTTVPNQSVKLATIEYGGGKYRQRGTVGDVLASFDGMTATANSAYTTSVKQGLGVPRPAVA